MAVPAKPDLTVSKLANGIRKLNTRIVEDVISIGKALAKAKAKLSHGEWLPWIEHELDWNERTAQSYMRLADMAKTKRVSCLARLRSLDCTGSPRRQRRKLWSMTFSTEKRPAR
ncbi:MAG TPA: DUF3102 domain-containing protein [Steroidobacteraceae bacterium]|jgi:hypothetical protein|nr:DUF3102 domain-containing protein [Steroidobacteraceae bacterium]